MGILELEGAPIADVFGSPVFGLVVSSVLAIAAIITSVVLYRRQRSIKALTYRTGVTPLVSVREQAMDKIAITYEGRPVSQVHLITVRIRNSGNVPILATDFNGPLAIELGAPTKLLSAETTETSPDELRPELALAPYRITITPLLLNAGDFFSISILASDYEDELDVSARVAGVSEGPVSEGVGGTPTRAPLWPPKTTGQAQGWGFAGATVLGAIVVGIGTLAGWFPNKEHTKVSLTGGRSYCGKILRTGDTALLLKVKGSGRLRSLPVSEIKSIRDKNC